MRLVTRGDLDGLTCAVLITSCEKIDEILLVHPQDITDKRLAITDDDILANLPYHAGLRQVVRPPPAHREQRAPAGDVRRPLRPRPQRGPRGLRVLPRGEPRAPAGTRRLLAETDRLDSAQLNIDDVLEPEGLHPARLHPRPAHRPGRLPGLLPEARGVAEDRPHRGDPGARPRCRSGSSRIREQDAALPRGHRGRTRASTATWSSPTSAT